MMYHLEFALDRDVELTLTWKHFCEEWMKLFALQPLIYYEVKQREVVAIELDAHAALRQGLKVTVVMDHPVTSMMVHLVEGVSDIEYFFAQ